MIKRIDGENSIYEFSFSEFMDIQKLDYSKKNSSYQSQQYGNKEFFGTMTFQESMYLLENGQKENPLEIGDFLKDLNFSSTENEMILSYEGFQVDISEYSTGNPECILNLLETEKENKNITIYYNCSYNGNIDSETIKFYGQMILSLIEILESKNINIKLVTIDRTADSNKVIHNISIVLKDFSESIDKDRISYCLSNNSFLRRNLFKMYEHILDENYRKDFLSGYGTAICDLNKANENDIYISSPYANKKRDFFIGQLKTILEKYK
jgi:hypothetical protein